MADAIRAFEPRIRADSLRVRALPLGREEGLPRVTLEISGELWAQPLPQELFLRHLDRAGDAPRPGHGEHGARG